MPIQTPQRVRSSRSSTFPSSASQLGARLAETGDGYLFWSQGQVVVDWIETHCVLTNAEWIGKPFRLFGWQKQMLLELFEVRQTDGEWVRRYRWALVGIPKKNGKTELVAALGLYFLIGDRESAPLVVVAAASKDQAGLVFGAARTMCEMSPTLSQVTDTYTDEIVVHGKPGARLQRVAAADGANDGANIHVVLIDELHEWRLEKHRRSWDILTNATGARRQPMIIQITTAGSDEETICYQQYEYGTTVRDGSHVDDRYYFYWVEADEADDYTEEKVWEKANPSWGLILRPDFYRDQLTKKSEATFRRYFLNQWTDAEEIWEAAQLWDGLVGEVLFDPDEPLHVAVDIGRRHDSSAVMCCQWNVEEQRLLVSGWIWQNPYPRTDSRYGQWTFTIASVENTLRQLYDDFPAPALQIGRAHV